MKPTVKDIAKLVNVSPATVSNALNNRKGVSSEIKNSILKAAKALGYSKDTSTEKHIIRFIIFKKHGYVVSDTPFFSSLIEGIEKECRAQGYEMMISHINTSEDNYRDLINNISNDSSSGILLLSTEMCKEDILLFENGITPTVVLDTYFKGMDFDSVLINNTDAAYKATCHLVHKGHIEIGYLQSSIYINNFFYRKQGYLDALTENGLKPADSFQILLEPTMEGSYRDMKKFLERNMVELPTAFFADNDIIAFGAMRALKEREIRIPQDTSIIGFDDMPFCEITSPRLTTIRVYKQEMGSIAVKRLIEKIEARDSTIQKIEIGSDLIIRDSVMERNKSQ